MSGNLGMLAPQDSTYCTSGLGILLKAYGVLSAESVNLTANIAHTSGLYKMMSGM